MIFLFETFEAIVEIREESTPPDSSTPTGTSATSCCFTDVDINSSTLSIFSVIVCLFLFLISLLLNQKVISCFNILFFLSSLKFIKDPF